MLAVKPRVSVMTKYFIFCSRTWKTRKETIWHMIPSCVPKTFFECPFTFLINKKCQIESASQMIREKMSTVFVFRIQLFYLT